MATVKIDTAVDASAFAAMYEIFSRFQAGVNAQPDAWGKVAAAGGEARGSLEDAARSVRTLADNMDDILHRVRGLDSETEKVSRRWTSLARGTKEAASHIKDATGSLLKWAGITGLVAGVAGFGAEHLMFGLGRGVSANRSAAMGAGTSYGGLQAARLAYGRYGSGEGMLGKIADAQGDPSQRLPFGAVGMGAKDYAGRDSADVLSDFMKHAKDTLDKIPDGELGSRLRVTHLGDFMSLEEARRMKADSRENVFGQADSIAGNKRLLNLDPKVQLKWQQFTTAMERAGTTMETMLVNKLVALEPGLLKLSESATKIAETFLKQGGAVDTWLGEIDHGMEWLANNIDKPEFQDRVSGFVTQIGELGAAALGLARGAGRLLHWLAKLVGDGDAPAPGGLQTLASGSVGDHIPTSAAAVPHSGGRRGFGGLQRPLPALGGQGMTGLRSRAGSRGGWWTDDRMRHAYDRLVKGGLTPLEAQGQIARMAYVEAGAGPSAHNASGHLGIYQADRNRQKNFGGSTDFDAQLDAIAKEKASSEAYSHRIGKAATDDYGAAVAASAFERGEGYDPRSGRDNFTGKTMSAIPEVRRIVAPTVTINKNTGANPPALAAAVAAPQ